MATYQEFWPTGEQQHEQSDSASSGAVETTSLGATSTTDDVEVRMSPLEAWIDASGWTRQDVELALQMLNLLILAALVWTKMKETN